MQLSFPIVEDLDPTVVEAGRMLFHAPIEFLKGVVAMDGMPPADRIELCFAGRSNVGKSSLINALTGRKGLARASNTPGRTQEINFFTVGDEHYIVDLPGYGFANAPVAIVEKWQRLLKRYLAGRPTLRRVFVLIDSPALCQRHCPTFSDIPVQSSWSNSAATPWVIKMPWLISRVISSLCVRLA
ncbi:MAG: ribosome biogenesis GTP-binding protein YsxC [Marivivens sp.]|nr:ribosome biogenesis GTP-binding protein YsxC [Marivivens sp.]